MLIAHGANGDDTLYGGRGDDTLYGGAGRDRQEGGAGDDLIFDGPGDGNSLGGEGNDTIDGGAMTELNIVTFTDADTAINIDLSAGTATHLDGEVDTLINITAVNGSGCDDTITGGDYNGVAGIFGFFHEGLTGVDGNDIINGNGGNDFVFGGNGDDTITGGAGLTVWTVMKAMTTSAVAVKMIL